MPPHEILTKARALIEDPANWFTGEIKNSKEGQLCAGLALGKAAVLLNVHPSVTGAASNFLSRITGNRIARFNDTHTHAEVLAAFDKAIALAKEETV